MPETHFGEWIAERYEILWPELFGPAVIDPTVDFLAQLAAAGPALELGIGIGRIALPLRAAEALACAGSWWDSPAGLPAAQHDHEPHHTRRADLDVPHVWET
jgi:hypothetical protein